MKIMISGLALALAAMMAPAYTSINYGDHPRQALDLAQTEASDEPVVLFVHGGGWAMGDKRRGAAQKPDFITGLGWAFATTNYRLVPDHSVEEQAADVAAAVAALADVDGINGRRVVLMGHSAGAHLAALVASDPQYLGAAGTDFSVIAGVILLDGAGYDVEARMDASGRMASRWYQAAFGDDPARWQALSPTYHTAAPNADNWLILPIARREVSKVQSGRLADGLTAAGNDARVVAIAGESHGSLNRGLGDDANDATAVVREFLASL